jgi:hypothetical protein
MTTPRVSYETFDFLDHTLCQTSQDSLSLSLSLSHLLYCFLYFPPSQIYSTNYSVLVFIVKGKLTYRVPVQDDPDVEGSQTDVSQLEE